MIRLAEIKTQLAPLRDARKLMAIEAFASMPESIDQIKVTPTLFILLPARSASPNEVGTAAVRQTVSAQYGFLAAFKNVGARWIDKSEEVQDCISAIEDQLLAWTPDRQVHSPFELVESAPLDSDTTAGTYLHGITFSSREHVRKP